jgi:hypothetical protein
MAKDYRRRAARLRGGNEGHEAARSARRHAAGAP